MAVFNQQGIIFNSVKTFVEQIGRRQIWRYAELDQMTTVFNGPSALASRYRPQVNSPHPDFPLMFCTDSQITNRGALIAEIQATYVGIMDQSVLTKFKVLGGTVLCTPPVWSISPTSGSRDFQELWLQEFPVVVTSSAPGPTEQITLIQRVYLCNAGTRAVTTRYTGTQATCKYQAYPSSGQLPIPLEIFGEGIKKVTWKILSIYYGQISIALTGTSPDFASQWYSQQGFGVPPLFAAFMGSTETQRGKWWDVTETYAPTF